MQLFKTLTPVKALSFDLDDTLYDNKPVIAAAEQAMLQALAQQVPETTKLDSEFWWQQRLQLAKTNPAIRHDIGRWRLLGIEAGLVSLGLATGDAAAVAKMAYGAFLAERTRISLTPDVIALLSALAQRYTLIAITNGNACIDKMGIGELFEFSLQAGPDGRMKPYADLFLAAANRLQVQPNQILHIGDSHRADVMGALNAGCQAAWLDHHQSAISVLPHIRLTDVQQLTVLL
ncbi:MAG: HAD-IA family hydrolase [Gammaproteobacteria bacterium]|nr:HAD-IA family hydrolase [Gammaproteobacteria bacterium]MBU1557315.1 HAD-IA family hydrolase [Gammaproteobacteria bacterium]MBU2070921.1 HAD-IA family hydrolase [Gammaproteobacteria bacterium]MBU2181571.1 HAD-IA family hydrolase [Gammaproteobacteria bacterium]MBU2204851.1 HAD-IA family hydrolase [Gammaproteobacteria bacterium]